MSLKNIRMYNVGFGKFLCQNKGGYPMLCDEGTYWNIVTFSATAQLDNPNANNVGNMIVGTGSNANWWLSGTMVEDNNRVYSLPWGETKGHFWKVHRRGYKSFMMRYGWNAGGEKCMTPNPGDARAKGDYAGKILLTFEECKAERLDQYWYYGY